MVAVRQESWLDGQRGEGLYGCRADAGRQGRCPCWLNGIYDNHPAFAVRADTSLPSLLSAHLFVGLPAARLWDGRSSELFLHLAELIAAGR